MTGRLLAFSQDPSFLNEVGDRLKEAGLRLQRVQEPVDVLTEVSRFKPELILIDRAAPGGAAPRVVELLRTSPEAATIPLAFVLADSSGRELVRALQAGAVEVIPRPFGPVHVERIIQLLKLPAGAPPATGATPEEQVAHHFVDIARRHKLSGSLLVNWGTSIEGRISFKDGGLVRAEYGPLTGMEAIREILQLEEAVFELDALLDRPVAPVFHSVTEIKPGRPLLGPGDTVDIRPRALVVEPEPDVLDLLTRSLGGAGFDVTQAREGVEGVEAALASPFDLVVSDLVMPGKDGWDLLKVLKSDYRANEVPVILLSDREDFLETLRSARAGACAYLARTGLSEAIVSSALAAITPRLETLMELLVAAPLKVRAQTLGLQWTLRALKRMGSTGVLALQDDGGAYRLEVKDGQPVAVLAEVQEHDVSGVSAFARMLLARHAQGTFTHGSVVGSGQSLLGLAMEPLIQHTCEKLNAAETRRAEQRLSAATGFDADRDLYKLFLRIGSRQRVELARAICEQRVPPGELAKALNSSPEEAGAGVRELLRRGVIKLRAERADAPPG